MTVSSSFTTRACSKRAARCRPLVSKSPRNDNDFEPRVSTCACLGIHRAFSRMPWGPECSKFAHRHSLAICHRRRGKVAEQFAVRWRSSIEEKSCILGPQEDHDFLGGWSNAQPQPQRLARTQVGTSGPESYLHVLLSVKRPYIYMCV